MLLENVAGLLDTFVGNIHKQISSIKNVAKLLIPARTSHKILWDLLICTL